MYGAFFIGYTKAYQEKIKADAFQAFSAEQNGGFQHVFDSSYVESLGLFAQDLIDYWQKSEAFEGKDALVKELRMLIRYKKISAAVIWNITLRSLAA